MLPIHIHKFTAQELLLALGKSSYDTTGILKLLCIFSKVTMPQYEQISNRILFLLVFGC